jgi:hypothetical protein
MVNYHFIITFSSNDKKSKKLARNSCILANMPYSRLKFSNKFYAFLTSLMLGKHQGYWAKDARTKVVRPMSRQRGQCLGWEARIRAKRPGSSLKGRGPFREARVEAERPKSRLRSKSSGRGSRVEIEKPGSSLIGWGPFGEARWRLIDQSPCWEARVQVERSGSRSRGQGPGWKAWFHLRG